MPKHLTHAAISKPMNGGRYFDTTKGLHLYVKNNGKKYWVYRFTHNKKRHDLGLGSYPETALSEARDKALEARSKINKGVNPISRDQMLLKAEKPLVRFKKFAEEHIEMNSIQWRNKKHVSQWKNTMRDYVYPVIGDLPLSSINTEHILAIISPIWANKTETAARIRGRIERILSAAITRGLREAPNPAIWRGHLENVLPSIKKVARVKHHKALPYNQIQELIKQLRDRDCIGALALEFLILTASRSGEVRFAKWDEISDDLWVIPSTRMKANKEHKVPLTPRCVEILELVKSIYGKAEYVFHRKAKPLSNVAMPSLLNRIKPGFTVHGFRSTFRDWVAEETEHSGEVAEMALAHQIQNRVEASYRRGNLLSRRRSLMLDWELFCNGLGSNNIVSMNHRKIVA